MDAVWPPCPLSTSTSLQRRERGREYFSLNSPSAGCERERRGVGGRQVTTKPGKGLSSLLPPPPTNIY